MTEHPTSPVRLWPHIYEVSKREGRERTEGGRRDERGGSDERNEMEKVDGE